MTILEKAKEVAGNVATAVEHAAEKVGAVAKDAGGSIVEGAKKLAHNTSDAAKQAGAAINDGAHVALDKTKEVGGNVASSTGSLASRAAGAVVATAEKITGKDLNKDGKVG
jgi:hypothetical protein